jgi:hypothetical protein
MALLFLPWLSYSVPGDISPSITGLNGPLPPGTADRERLIGSQILIIKTECLTSRRTGKTVPFPWPSSYSSSSYSSSSYCSAISIVLIIHNQSEVEIEGAVIAV